MLKLIIFFVVFLLGYFQCHCGSQWMMNDIQLSNDDSSIQQTDTLEKLKKVIDHPSKIEKHNPEKVGEMERWQRVKALKVTNNKGPNGHLKPLNSQQKYFSEEQKLSSDFAAEKVHSLLNFYEKFSSDFRGNFLEDSKIRRKRSERSENEDIVTSEKIGSDESKKDKLFVPDREEWYPAYHLAPPRGWMNDPNGLIEFEGYFHAFYQHNPSAPVWGDINWGHARSKNLIEWEHLPEGISPSIEEDKDGCFSGSAVDDNGVLTLLYTGNIFLEDDHLQQVTCIATSNDTINFTKHGMVLDHPEGVEHFRDPKAWWGGEDTWYMVMGTRDGDLGEAHLYKSEDLHQWQFVRILAKAERGLGYMWECPDFFPLGDKHLLVISPQGISPDKYKYRNLYQSGYFLGTWEPDGPFHIEKNFTEMDNGHDFYAPQTFLASDQRRIVIGWMAMWESPFPEQHQNWSGMFTLPREFHLSEDGSLRINPVREVMNFRGIEKNLNRTILHNEHLELDTNTRATEIIMVWNIRSSDAEKFGLRLGDKNLTEAGLYLYIDAQSERLTLDRRYAQYSLSGYRSIPIPKDELLTLRVFFDHSSVEVFVNGGERCMSSRIYPLKDQRHLTIFAENGNAILESSSLWPIEAKQNQHLSSVRATSK
ncbi:sucrose-6-phosphate hydrolase [Trichonephila clavata]|uniref:Sucrose-6-phosphate hydrolase n=1 Tax=Trichonephila clavata TaxID=2740835 RepID=A0A8X6J8B1_TRICU|nr:sucrose-6-phosphate hydrolase [Trichonephila clavata]